jgi:hypothetical protein
VVFNQRAACNPILEWRLHSWCVCGFALFLAATVMRHSLSAREPLATCLDECPFPLNAVTESQLEVSYDLHAYQRLIPKLLVDGS